MKCLGESVDDVDTDLFGRGKTLGDHDRSPEGSEREVVVLGEDSEGNVVERA